MNLMKIKKPIIICWFLILLLVIISLNFDSEIVKVVSSIRNNFLDNVFLGIAFISSEVIIFFLLTSLFLWQENKRKWILPLWITLGVTALVGFLLKIAVQRARPYQQGIVEVLAILQKESHNIWNFSFPSFHTMLAFCAIPILSKEFPKLKYFWIIFAGIIAFLRIYFGVHFLSDVIVGGVIGYLIGWFILKIEEDKRIFRRIF